MKKLLVLLGLLIFTAPAFAADRYASVDLEKVVRSYSKTNAINAQFQKEEADIRMFVLEAQKKVISAKTDAERKSLEERYNKELQSKVESLQVKKNDALRAIEMDIKKEIDKIGATKTYTLILTSNNALWGTEDISDIVIKALNK